MKIDIISGFLGSGKTTLIKKLLADELCKEKIAIIENEYGEVAIDGNLLRNDKIEVKEITSGCICCSIKGDFRDSMHEIVAKYSPDRIIVEPTGVAKLSEIIESVKDAKVPKANINIVATIVDVNNFSAYLRNFGEFYKNQISNAKLILLSRVSNISESELLKINEEIRKLNSSANIITTDFNKLTSKRIIEIGEVPREKLITEFKKTVLKGKISVKKNNKANDIFENWGTETSKSFDEITLKRLLDSLSNEEKYGKVLRAKGIVPTKTGKWVQFDYVPGEATIKRFSADYTGRVCVIGSSLNKTEIENLFLKKK